MRAGQGCHTYVTSVQRDHALDVTTACCFLLERSPLAAHTGSVPSITTPSKHEQCQSSISAQLSDNEYHDRDMIDVAIAMSFPRRIDSYRFGANLHSTYTYLSLCEQPSGITEVHQITARAPERTPAGSAFASMSAGFTSTCICCA